MSSLGDSKSINPASDHLTLTGGREDRCEHCKARITHTLTMGEAGHLLDCPVRDERYNGRANKRWQEMGAEEL